MATELIVEKEPAMLRFAGTRAGWAHLGRMVPTMIACVTLVVSTGCTVSRRAGTGRAIGSYDYCVVGKEGAHRYAKDATEILSRSFVVLPEEDPRLKLPAIGEKACVLRLHWSRGFWSSAARADLMDYRNETLVHRSFMRRGMFWAGYHGDVLDVLQDVAAMRASGPPIPAEARLLPPANLKESAGARSKADRLMELNDLKARGLITESEYSIQRAKIIDEP